MTDIPDQKLKFRSRFPEADQGSAELNKPLAERFKGKPRAHARAVGEKPPQHVACEGTTTVVSLKTNPVSFLLSAARFTARLSLRTSEELLKTV